MTWRLLDEDKTDIFHSLSVEEALARVNAQRNHKINTLRFWRTGRSVVMGRFQCAHLEANLQFCMDNDVKIARRFTGGGTVYHDLGNLNFALCMNQAEPYVGRTLSDLYSHFIGQIAYCLQDIGIPAQFDPKRSCIRIRGRKITGTAGSLKKGVSFIHGTLLINADLNMLRNCLDVPLGQPRYSRSRGRIRCMESEREIVTNITAEVPDCPDASEIKKAIVHSIERISNDDVKKGKLDQLEVETAQSLYRDRYSHPEWNMGIPIE